MWLRVYDSEVETLFHSTVHAPGSTFDFDSNHLLNTTVEWQYSGRGEEPLIAYPELMRKVPFPAPKAPDGSYL